MLPNTFTNTPEVSLATLPVMNSRVMIGPKEYVGGRPMHFAKLRGSTRYFRMGEKEVFLLTRMDGSRTPEEISIDYATRFRKRLNAPAWSKAMQLFAQRGLLDGEAEVLQDPAEGGLAPLGRAQTGLFSHKLVHWNPDTMLEDLVPWTRWLINGPVLLLWISLVFVCELLLLRHSHQVWSVASTVSGSVPRALTLVTTLIVMTALHEMGHAISCKRYGGEVRELGLLVRYFMVCAYARIDDILLLKRRQERLYVLLIGPLIGLTIVPAALVLWFSTAPHSLTHFIAADLLIWYNFGCLMQLLPFLKLDGYYMLAQVLKMPELRTDSYNYLLALGRHWLRHGEQLVIAPDCASYVRPTYVVYGVFSALASTLFIGWTLTRYGLSLHHLLGFRLSLLVIMALSASILWRLYNEVFSKLRLKG